MSASPNAKLLESIPGLTEEVLKITRNQWGRTNTMRQIIGYRAAQQIERCRTALESCKPEELADFQGQIKATRELIATVNNEGEL